jgi:hypothetical protein
MDTQAVNLCPVLNVNVAYNKTKLQVHNFTIFNLATHQCRNYFEHATHATTQKVDLTLSTTKLGTKLKAISVLQYSSLP